ncbi:MAG: hypothetical protein WKF79_03370 [Nocardioides sp.]
MTTTTTRRSTEIPCPSWCTLTPGHPADSELDGRACRGHAGPNFGRSLSGGAEEYADAPGVLHYSVTFQADGEDITKPSDLLDLATQATAAARWLEAHR